MIESTQDLSEKDYKKVIAMHYFGYKYTYFNPILGIILLSTLVVFGLINPEILRKEFVFLFLIGLFLILRPYLYVQNVYKSLKTNKTLKENTTIKITDENKIVTTAGENTSSIRLKDLYSYFDKKTFLLLYIAKNQYLILDKRILSDSQYEGLMSTLKELRIRKR